MWIPYGQSVGWFYFCVNIRLGNQLLYFALPKIKQGVGKLVFSFYGDTSFLFLTAVLGNSHYIKGCF